MTLRRVGLSNSLSSQAKISNKRFTLSRVSLRRFPFPTAPGAPIIPNYIEEVFSTNLWAGNENVRLINNGIDLSTKGGLVWIKGRTQTNVHFLFDTFRGAGRWLSTSTTSEQSAVNTNLLNSFDTNGFTIGGDSGVNGNGANYVGWTFRRQAKFFDVVTYTGNGSHPRTITHNLGSAPGCIIFKRYSGGTASWFVYHRSLGVDSFMSIGTAVKTDSPGLWTNTNASVFDVPNGLALNDNAATYVAYVFAHNAGGFGATDSDNVISCGGYTTTTGATQDINLGYEPQWVLITRYSGAGAVSGWFLFDNMREMSYTDNVYLQANSAAADAAIGGVWIRPTPTGFTVSGALNGGGTAGYEFMYIAIRRGPMKTPTTGTSVFSPKATQGPSSGSITSANPNYDAGFPVDFFLRGYKPGGISVYTQAFDRLRGKGGGYITTSTPSGETGDNWVFDSQIGVYNTNATTNSNNCAWLFRRAPGFFDVVCYSGDNVNGRQIPHNLGVTPELAISKSRAGGDGFSAGWPVGFNINPSGCSNVYLHSNGAAQNNIGTFPLFGPATSSYFTMPNAFFGNYSSVTYVAYLFASCPGVSKVGLYTGTGTTLSVDCGFAAGARFVMIKRTDDTGDWYVWDTARGIAAGNDPYLLMNSTAAEVTSTDYIDPYSPGFEISSAAPAAINASGGNYLFLAIA